MNQKELNEIRRCMSPEKNNIQKIYGCYVNGRREIVSYLDESMALMPEVEAERYIVLLKKALSGKLSRNLVDIPFSASQVQHSGEHGLLMALRETRLTDGGLRRAFYQKVIETLDMGDDGYLILLAYDTYDIPRRGRDGTPLSEADDGVFRYFVCAVCPVKAGKTALGYFSGENEFHNCGANQVVAPPELGFLFPAFDNRTTNIYNALYYAKNPAQLHQEFIDAVFHIEAPMSAAEQREAFESALAESLETDCSYDVVQTVHEQLRERMENHREEKDPEPLRVSAQEVSDILASAGVNEDRIRAFQQRCGEHFGSGAALNPVNIIESGRFELTTPQAKVTVDPEASYLVETRVIDGKRFILVPADEQIEVNGFQVHWKEASK